jgi:tetratricopeptide (TPR) repeat protein
MRRAVFSPLACAPAVWAVVAGVAMLLAVGRAGAQSGSVDSGAMPAMDGMEMIPPPEQLPAPLHMTGIGDSHIAIRANAETQAWFDQGLSLLHDFWDYESARAFEQAIRTDPQCAMCYWGLSRALAFRGDFEKTYADQALAQAARFEDKAGRTNRLYIEAALAESKEKGDDHSASIAIYRKLVKREPKDIEARIFLANALGDGFDDKGEPKPGEKEKIAILEGVLKDAPDDSAANHYWIHAMEPGNHPERAIASAALLASLAPASGHMVHMPGHIYYRVGDYASADHWFAASMVADEKYMREQHVSVDEDWNYVHNMMYAIANKMEQGRLEDADRLSDHLAAARGHLSESLYIWSARDQVSRVSRRLPVALRVGDWDAVLTMLDDARLDDNANTANLRFLKDELHSFATGMRALEQGDPASAQAASAEMDAGLWREGQDAQSKSEDTMKTKLDTTPASTSGVPAAAGKVTLPLNPDAMNEPLVKMLSVDSLELRAGVLLLEGKADQAKATYQQAIAAEKKLGYHEPPFYIRPVAETEAAALLRAKDYAGAKKAYQEALIERPNSGFELYGIARADELAGQMQNAKTEYSAFLKAWPSADPGLPQMVHAHQVLGLPESMASK